MLYIGRTTLALSKCPFPPVYDLFFHIVRTFNRFFFAVASFYPCDLYPLVPLVLVLQAEIVAVGCQSFPPGYNASIHSLKGSGKKLKPTPTPKLAISLTLLPQFPPCLPTLFCFIAGIDDAHLRYSTPKKRNKEKFSFPNYVVIGQQVIHWQLTGDTISALDTKLRYHAKIEKCYYLNL